MVYSSCRRNVPTGPRAHERNPTESKNQQGPKAASRINTSAKSVAPDPSRSAWVPSQSLRINNKSSKPMTESLLKSPGHGEEQDTSVHDEDSPPNTPPACSHNEDSSMAQEDPRQHAPVNCGQAVVAHSAEDPWKMPPPKEQFSWVALVQEASAKQQAPVPVHSGAASHEVPAPLNTPPAAEHVASSKEVHESPRQQAPVCKGQSVELHGSERPWNTPPPKAQLVCVAFTQVASGKQHAPVLKQSDGRSQSPRMGSTEPPASRQSVVVRISHPLLRQHGYETSLQSGLESILSNVKESTLNS